MPEWVPDAYNELPPDLMKRVKNFDPGKWERLVSSGMSRGFGQRLAYAELVPGFDKDIRASTAKYISGLSRWNARAGFEVAMDKITEGMNPETDGRVIQHLQGYRDRVVSPNSEWTQVMSFLNLNYLAGAVSSGAVNATQPLVTTLPELYARTGSLASATELFTKAQPKTWSYLKELWTGKPSPLAVQDPQLHNALTRAFKHGLLEQQAFEELTKAQGMTTAGPSIKKLNQALMVTFTVPEQANRVISFISGFELGRKMGLKGDALQKYAEDLVTATQFDQSPANRPAWSTGKIGKPLFLYKLYAGNMLRFYRHLASSRKYGPLALTLGVTALLGGATSITGVRDAKNIAESLGFDPTGAVRKFLQNPLYADAALYGIPTTAGWNISGNVGTGEYVQEIDKNFAVTMARSLSGAGMDYLAKIGKAG